MTNAFQEYSDSFGKEIAGMKDVIEGFLRGEVSAEMVNETNDRCFAALDKAVEKYHRDLAKEKQEKEKQDKTGGNQYV